VKEKYRKRETVFKSLKQQLKTFFLFLRRVINNFRIFNRILFSKLNLKIINPNLYHHPK